jgi:hypothetical protein
LLMAYNFYMTTRQRETVKVMPPAVNPAYAMASS